MDKGNLNWTRLLFFLFAWIFLLSPFIVEAQSNFLKYRIVFQSETTAFSDSDFSLNKEVQNQKEGFDNDRELLRQLLNLGYLTAAIDSFAVDTNFYTSYVYVGSRYQLKALNTDAVPDDWIPPFWRNVNSSKPFATSDLNSLCKAILTKAENQGFPFANVKISADSIADDGIWARLDFAKGHYYQYDSVEIIGDAQVSSKFLRNYLHLRKDNYYNEKDVRAIDGKLRQLPFVKLAAPTRVYFGYDQVRIQVFLDEKKSDRLDGIIGFAPNSESSEGKLLLTGELNIDMVNLFQRGVGFETHWKSFLQNSQELELGFSYPYIFNTDIGMDMDMALLKLDTTFLRLQTSIGTRVLLSGSDHIRFYYSSQNTTLISPDTNGIRISRTLPRNNPVKINSYGLGLKLNRLDYIFNPRSGLSLFFDGNIGTRKIERNSTIEQVEIDLGEGNKGSVYDLLELASLQAEFKYAIEVYIPIFDKSAIKLGVNGNQLFAENILRNDLYRFGGARSLRGFDEKSLEGHSVHVFLLEYRYLLNREANFHVFGNLGYMENANPLQGSYQTDLPYGFGAGINIQLPNGLFNLDYALGAQNDLPFQFNRAKVHFGLINYL